METERPKIEHPESNEKPSRLIREFLDTHPNATFEEMNSLTSLVEPEVDLYASRKFRQYEDAHVSRVIDQATSIGERPTTESGRSYFTAEAPFYLYESEKKTDSFARLTVYKKAIVVVENKGDNLNVHLAGIKEGGVYASAEKIYERRYVQQIAESANPLESLKKLEEDEKVRNSMMAYSREMMRAFTKSYNTIFSEELALTEKIEQVRGAVENFPPQSVIKEILQTIPQDLRSFINPYKDFTIEETLKELVAKGSQMDSHRFDLHRAIEYFGYKFGSGMNKKEIDKAILIDRCPDKLESKGGRYVGVIKNPTGVYYLFGTESDYSYEGRGRDKTDRRLIESICAEINSKFGSTTASLDDKQGGSTHTYWRQVGLAIDNLPKDEESLNQINQIIQRHIDEADSGTK
ncbi:MAG: hypothetical protein KW788_01585 [Candidatus Doudnabacteria bacterium]|nr:hypothetical protein [Candidatus Doudnabacteria bacterium]